jgi:type III pantothenate kinase
MNLIIDIGNTVAKIAVFDGENMLEQMYDSNQELPRLKEMFERYRPENAAVVSVIDLTDDARRELNSLPIPILYIDHHTPLPIKNLYETPETLGYDRVAAVVGAFDRFPGRNVLIVDSGTCITYEFINSDGEYLGGNISLGVSMRLKALHSFTGHLPLVQFAGRDVDMGVDTETAIRAGVMKGMEYEIAGYINSLEEKYDDLLVFLTGGKQFPFESNLKSSIFVDKFLVLRGLNRILNDYIDMNQDDKNKKA